MIVGSSCYLLERKLISVHDIVDCKILSENHVLHFLSYLILVGSFQKLEKVIEVIAHFDREGTPSTPQPNDSTMTTTSETRGVIFLSTRGV